MSIGSDGFIQAFSESRHGSPDLGLVPPNYDLALHCSDCGHFLLPHDAEGHDRWHQEQAR